MITASHAPTQTTEQLLAEARRRLHESQLAGARHLYLDLLDSEPALASICLHDLGLIAAMQEHHARAAELFRHALRLDPHLLDAHKNLVFVCERSGTTGELNVALLAHGDALLAHGKHREAADVFRRILAHEPLHYAATAKLGNALMWLGEGEAAAQWLARALRLLGRLGMALGNYTAELQAHLAERFRLDGSPAPDGQPVALVDRGENALALLATLLTERGFAEEALACLAKIVAELPNDALAHLRFAGGLLITGDYVQGWREYEWRWQCPDFPAFNRRHLPLPLWQGEPLTGKHILVWMEQGYGDAMQFMPLLSRLVAQGATVTVEVVPELLRLFAANLPDITVLTRPGRPEEAPAGDGFDFAAPMLGLPLRLGLTMADLPLATSYLHPLPEDTRVWGERLAGRAGVKVGLVWAGDPKHGNDGRRSLTVETLRPLLDIPGVSWHSLQVGPASGQLRESDGVRDLAPQLHDFADTAAAVSALDLIIAVDTSVAHLAAAQGKPVWLLLSALGEWRWGLETRATPWYPSMRIFRQFRPASWEEVISAVRGALVDYVAAWPNSQLAGSATQASSTRPYFGQFRNKP